MAIYLKKFETTPDYENYIQGVGAILPNVSLCEDTNGVHYNPKHDYSQDYFTTIAKGDGEFTLKIESAVYTSELSYISYSKDNGETWVRTDNRDYATVNITVDVNEGDKVLWKGKGLRLTSGYQSPSGSTFLATTDFTVEGNIMSLLSSDTEFENAELAVSGGSSLMPVTYDFHFARLFSGNTHIIDAENLVFAVNAPLDCYSDMFRNCVNLEKAPRELRAEGKVLGYSAMFWGCSKIKKAPEIKANALNSGMNMFNGCTSLVEVPDIKATAFGGCANMFANCTSLVAAPKMNPLTVSQWAFNGAFRGCTSLKVPPQLPATAVTNNCYSFMFSGCTSLTTAPELPATTLVNECYASMFKDCPNLNYVKCNATQIEIQNATQNWLNGVNENGTFTKASSMTSWTTGPSGIPSGWSVVDA